MSDIVTCDLCDRVIGGEKGQCLYTGCRGCKIVQGRLQLAVIDAFHAKTEGAPRKRLRGKK